MAKKIQFTKMHGTGNDYIYVNTMKFPISHPNELAMAWSKPHTGIGADGLVLIGHSDIADFGMRIFNADGSEAMMCGNASRCIGKYVYEKGLTDRTTITLETLSGIKELRLTTADSIGTAREVIQVTVDMGVPVISNEALPVSVGGTTFTGTVVSMGNPHFVLFVDDLAQVDVATSGTLLECHPTFPNRTNVEFVQIRHNGEMRMRVWERGSGITQACGTGACASLMASAASRRTTNEAKVIMDGGTLSIRHDQDSGHVFMTGGATLVYEGEIRLDDSTIKQFND